MFLVILLFLVILFYPYKEHFLNTVALDKLHNDFDDVFNKSSESIREDRYSYINLYNALIKVK